MHRHKIILLSALIIAVSFLASCAKDAGTEPADSAATVTTTVTIGSTDSGKNGKTVAQALAENCGSHEASTDYTWNSADAVQITLNGTSIASSGAGVTISGTTATITAAGTYSISGTLSDGKIVVKTTGTDPVRLIFNGVNITNTTNAPIDIEKAPKAIIVLADNTQNYLTDASVYVFPNAKDDEPNAALYSKTNMTITGGGSLTVKANYNDGITSKDGLVIKSGTINVTSVDDGIRGKDYLIIKDGNITVSSTGDGLKSDNEDEADKGYICVASGILNVTSGGDAITAETDALIGGGTLSIKSGGGSGVTPDTTTSTKGIKGIVSTIIDGGTISLNCSDDALHSNSTLVFNNGSVSISTGDDGMHADSSLYVYNGTINITKSYEGIESATLDIEGGNIHIVSSDDGLNGAGGNDSSAKGPFATLGNYFCNIKGGLIVITSSGDGIDVNGSITMTGGTVIVNGPTANDNGAIDYDREFKISGGVLVAAGSSGMAQSPGTGSSQYSVLVSFRTAVAANTLINVRTSDGTGVFTFRTSKTTQSIAFSSSLLAQGKTYEVYTGGSSTGTLSEGLYAGTYSGGTKAGSFSISAVSTKVTF